MLILIIWWFIEMRRLCYIIIILVAILFVPLEARLSSNVFVPYQHDSPSFHLQKLWAEHMQKNCSKELAEMKKELGGCDLYLSFKASTIWLKPTSHETLTTLQSKLQQHVLDCARKHYNRFPGHATRPKLLLHLSKPPRRYLADSSHKASASKAASPAPDIFDDPIIIPPNLLFPSPPPSSGDSPNAGAANNDQMNKIITIAVSVSGILVIFALCLFCCLRKGRGGYAYTPKDDKPLLTLSSSSSTGSNTKDVGRNDNTGFNHSTPNLEVLGGTLPGIPEHDSDVSANSEELSSEQCNPGKSNTPAAAAPPPPPPPKPKPAPPPPPKGIRPPPAPPRAGAKGRSASGDSGDASDPDSSRTKLKPFFWDKVVGSPDHSMVWDEIRSGSFQFNEEMIESLFGYNPDDKKNAKRKNGLNDSPQPQYIQIIDAKKSQNLSILLKALNVTTEEVRDALLEGNELPAELLQTLLRMAPTQEEELKLRLFTGDIAQLGPADKFLKVLVDIPFAFKRMESLSFMMTFKDEVSNIKESFVTLEVACDELKKSRLFLKLLEAVLKTGNRMNDGTYRGGAQAFKLDTLLKLADVKGTDGKTTLLHFVVQEIIRSESLKALRAAKDNRSISSMKTEDFVEDPTYDASEQHRILGLEIVSGISSELENVKKAAIIDGDIIASTVTKLGQSLQQLKTFLDNEMSESQDENGFHEAVVSFVQHSESQVTWLVEEEKRISSLVRKTADYFHGNSGREEGLRLFSIVRDFMHMLDKICTELKQSIVKKANRSSRESSSVNRSSLDQNSSIQDMRQKLFPAIADRRVGDSTSDSDND